MRHSGHHGTGMAGLLAALLAIPPGASAAATQVVITGGPDQTRHQYDYTVTNQSAKRIVRIEFPQYGADLFVCPTGWTSGSVKEMNLVNIGWDDKHAGTAWAETASGLAPGASAQFQLRVASMGALTGSGTVRVRFDDGSWGEVPGVQLPQMPQRTSPYLALVATGGIFVIFIIVRERRRRRNPPAAAADAEDD